LTQERKNEYNILGHFKIKAGVKQCKTGDQLDNLKNSLLLYEFIILQVNNHKKPDVSKF